MKLVIEPDDVVPGLGLPAGSYEVGIQKAVRAIVVNQKDWLLLQLVLVNWEAGSPIPPEVPGVEDEPDQYQDEGGTITG